ncbi:ABC transporter permease [uncultured Pseudacidovorax sp.]|uniref:ABC transporter permease n=1 Tax=uncultured Pseudacidovorax sp. TaxID=679313 RepID=UPI0025CD80EE|nr:ABC transporter permease [uncultured Pseudacidovorax sp.]
MRHPASALALLRRQRANVLLPLSLGLAFLFGWEALVRLYQVPKFVLPAPSLILQTLVQDAPALLKALRFTAAITLGAFCLALASGLVVGVLLTQSRPLEKALWPYALVLQVTPMVAIAPLIVIWVGLDRAWLALLIMAFFPVLSNTAIGLKSVDHGLRNVFELYGASPWKRFLLLQLPAALPYILGGVRISAGLAVIGAIVAEFVAGSGSTTGLAWTIVEAGGSLNIPRMFAALLVLSAFGIAIWYLTAFVQWLLLHRWHESESSREN